MSGSETASAAPLRAAARGPITAMGRATAEVGAVIIVGGNIEGFTRTMTTSIALETSKGNLERAVALGIVLVAIIMAVNGAVWTTRRLAERYSS